jgi:hypothetical protein
VLVRPEALTVSGADGGNGIVSGTTFLGSVTRIAVLLSGTVSLTGTVLVDVPSASAATLAPGVSVQVELAARDSRVLVTTPVGR